MNMNQLAKIVTLVEGEKKSVTIAQIKEVLKILSVLCFLEPDVILALRKNGNKLRLASEKKK